MVWVACALMLAGAFSVAAPESEAKIVGVVLVGIGFLLNRLSEPS